MDDKILLLIVLILVVTLVCFVLSKDKSSICQRKEVSKRGKVQVQSGTQELVLPFINKTITAEIEEPNIVLPFQKVVIPPRGSVQNTFEAKGHCSSDPPSNTLVTLDGQNCVVHEDRERRMDQ